MNRCAISSVIVPLILYPLPDSCEERLTISVTSGVLGSDGDGVGGGVGKAVGTNVGRTVGLADGFADGRGADGSNDGPGEDGDGADDVDGEVEGCVVREGW